MKGIHVIVYHSFYFLPHQYSTHEQDDYEKGLMYYQKQSTKRDQHLKAYTDTTPDPRDYYLIGYASYG